MAVDWRRYSDEPLSVFCDRAGVAIADAAPWFELAGGRRTSAAAFGSLLRSYAEPSGIAQALTRTAARLRRPQALLDAAHAWADHLPQLHAQLPGLLQVLQQTMAEAPGV
nr:ACP phosphodiesterase [Solimonas terrae]